MKRTKILIADPLAEAGVDILKQHFAVDTRAGMSEKELARDIPKYHGLIVRSGTRVTAKAIDAAANLKIVARAGVGVDNIDLDAATRNGIVVVNSPMGNTLSAAEHTLSLLMAMVRNIPAADRSLRDRKWERKAFTGTEISNKTLGVIGLGKVGAIVAEHAMGLGMKVVAHDPFAGARLAERLGVELMPLNTVLKKADFLTFHLPRTSTTYHLISSREFSMMKKGVRIVNCARGGIIDEAALLRALKSGRVAQAALDVFESEPPFDNPLLDMPNVIVTPHLGASTTEAQVNVALDVAHQIIDYFNGAPPKNAVNMPSVKPEIMEAHRPFFELGEKLGLFHAQLLDGNVTGIHITYSGASAARETALITRYVLVGFLKPTFHETVNFVNAPVLARTRGIKLRETLDEKPAKYSDLITVEVDTTTRTRVIAGTLFDSNEKRIVMVDNMWLDIVPHGLILYIGHRDEPGLVGKVGTFLGDNNINIAGMQVGRLSVRGSRAVMALSVDDDVSPETLIEMRKIKGVSSCRLLTF